MSYTVNQLAKLSGVSVRTLRFYDEINLLKPAYHGANGYRYYEEEQLLLLQQILFFRELEFELKQIKKILGRGDFDKIAALKSHRKTLQKNADRMKRLLKTIDKTIDHLTGEKIMNAQDMYYGFSKQQQEEYEKYLVNRIEGQAQDLIAESKHNTQSWKKSDWEKMKKESNELYQAFAKAIDQKLKVTSPVVQELVLTHFQIIKKFYKPTKEVYVGLGQLYVEHPDFQKFFDAYHPELAHFLAQAMQVFAERELS
jgi:DNA-binding transcriptional MerR regulator